MHPLAPSLSTHPLHVKKAGSFATGGGAGWKTDEVKSTRSTKSAGGDTYPFLSLTGDSSTAGS